MCLWHPQGESICRQDLMNAAMDKDLDALNLHLQKASEMGLTGGEVETAKQLQKELLVTHTSLKALRYAVDSTAVRSRSTGSVSILVLVVSHTGPPFRIVVPMAT